MEIINSKIEGVKIIKKNQIIDDRGSVMHMLRNDDENFKKFGEIYFSSVNPKFIKAWHLHEKMTLNYVAVYGKVKLVLFDDRKNSSSNGVLEEIIGRAIELLLPLALPESLIEATVTNKTAIVETLPTTVCCLYF